MKIRGRRECADCGHRWSYYETGEVACPDCGSLRSTGVDDRTEHTDSAVRLDLTDARNRVDDDLLDAASDAAEACREFVRQSGFIHAGELRPLSDTYLAAAELAAVSRSLDRSMRVSDAEELYLLSLLRGADLDDRPGPSDVPDSLRSPRALAYAKAVSDYRSDLRTWLDDHPDDAANGVLQSIAEHVRRFEALDGEVSPADSERLVRATQDIGDYLREGDEGALATAKGRLADID
ncbi:TFIIB-type zinc ribbon-containing protein [Halomarina salina]|uniref:TFIIB-type zinc ribbon-containing protein n=1 Tax=Halomarina salina TaxID=1872699 RepID=A0ABD5RR77_9EURY|nr:TFIIB-type zinc ribbon-containing protein [Halomarina salina]